MSSGRSGGGVYRCRIDPDVAVSTPVPDQAPPEPARSGSFLLFPFGSVSSFFRRQKQKPSAVFPVADRPQPSRSRRPQADHALLLSSLLATPPPSADEADQYIRIWQPDELVSPDLPDGSETEQCDFVPIWTSLPSAEPSAETSSLSASTASSVPSLMADGKSASKVEVPLTVKSVSPKKRSARPLTVKANTVRAPTRQAKQNRPRVASTSGKNRLRLADPITTDAKDQPGKPLTSIRLTERLPPESLPPALREIMPAEQDMVLSSETVGMDGETTAPDRGEPVLDRFGFQMLERASKFSLRTFQDRNAQRHKVDRWILFRRDCQAELQMTSPVEDAPLGMAKWASAGDTGRALQARFNSLVAAGVPVELRAEVWKEAIECRLTMWTGDYEAYCHQAADQLRAEVCRDIEFDVSRTLTHSNVFFYDGAATGSVRLRSILRAYAARNPDTGYCQGMNKIAAYVLLTVPDEPSVFGVFCAMIDAVMPSRYWTDSMSLASADQHLLKSLLSRALPDVYLHLQKLNSFVVPFTLRWFVSLYTDGLYNTSAEFVYRVWDVILTRPFPGGYNYLLAVALAIFHENQDAILSTQTTMAVHDVIARRLGVRDDRIDAVLAVADEMQFSVKVIDTIRDCARAQLADGDANAEGDIPGCVSSRLLRRQTSGRFPRLAKYVAGSGPRLDDRV